MPSVKEMNSSMVVTEPLTQEASDQIGWRRAELLGDYAHGYMYAQRTADNRIALGGRGIPYRFGSRIDDRGATALRCTTCHGAANFAASGVPGHPLWHMAPREMAWQGKSLAQICEQIKDPRHNGGRTLAQIHEHVARDSLVGWAWRPGGSREPAPGTQEEFGALIAAWIESGAICPVGQ